MNHYEEHPVSTPPDAAEAAQIPRQPTGPAGPDGGNLLEVRGLQKHFPITRGVIFKRKIGAVRAVDGIDLTIASGEIVGLAGESRSGDANGQWFRVLASGGTNLVTTRPGMFATTALPINGSIPPKSKRPPLEAGAPCELQDRPDLRSHDRFVSRIEPHAALAEKRVLLLWQFEARELLVAAHVQDGAVDHDLEVAQQADLRPARHFGISSCVEPCSGAYGARRKRR